MIALPGIHYRVLPSIDDDMLPDTADDRIDSVWRCLSREESIRGVRCIRYQSA